MVKSYFRGHEIIHDDHGWRYADNNMPVARDSRPCKRCGLLPTQEGYDACIGRLEGVSAACCGHGVSDPYIKFDEIGNPC
jgi:hypothetical protein